MHNEKHAFFSYHLLIPFALNFLGTHREASGEATHSHWQDRAVPHSTICKLELRKAIGHFQSDSKQENTLSGKGRVLPQTLSGKEKILPSLAFVLGSMDCMMPGCIKEGNPLFSVHQCKF